MEESGHTTRRRIWQPVSIPFIWEERPGTPKKDWKPEAAQPVSPAPATAPVKLIASVPFKWEEKPGMPLPCFSESTKLISLGSSERLPVDEQAMAVPCLDVVPYDPSFLEIPSSPSSDTDDSASSYATGSSSPVGSSFLECMFPLYQPDSSFLEKVGSSRKGPLTQRELMGDEFDRDLVVRSRRAPTLGELIMMSRRMSCQRKAVQVREGNVSMNGALGCCFFGANTNMLGIREHKPRLSLF